jgi:hypothetical protein
MTFYLTFLSLRFLESAEVAAPGSIGCLAMQEVVNDDELYFIMRQFNAINFDMADIFGHFFGDGLGKANKDIAFGIFMNG